MTAGLPCRAYLLPAEAAAEAGCCVRLVRLRIERGELAALRVGRLWRVEAQALTASAPEPIPDGREFCAASLAAHWRVSPETVAQLVTSGVLRGERRGGSLSISRRALVRFVVDHTREP